MSQKDIKTEIKEIKELTKRIRKKYKKISKSMNIENKKKNQTSKDKRTKKKGLIAISSQLAPIISEKKTIPDALEKYMKDLKFTFRQEGDKQLH